MWWPQKNTHICPTHISSKWQNPLPKVWSTSWWYVSEGHHFYEKPGWADWNYQLLTIIACSWVAQILSVFIIGHEPMLVMAALRSRCGHYIFALWFLFIYLLSFFYSSPNLSGRTVDIYHTSTHGVRIRMQVWNMLHAARYKYRTQKWCKKSPSWHHPTTLSGYIFATKACIDNQKKKLVKQQYLHHMSLQYGELRPTSRWDRFVSLGHPSKFQRVLRLGSVTARHLVVNVSQTLRRW